MRIFKKGTKIFSVAKLKCPRCQEGNLFLTKSHYNLKKFSIMHDKCPVCNQKYQLEPGFYYGAMYISYFGISVILVSVILPIFFIFEPPFIAFGLIILVLILFCSPLVFRFSRAIWINFFVKYNSVIIKNKRQDQN